jgi:copper chaperone
VIAFQVDDKSCAHCVQTITKAVKLADPLARVRIDLPSHRVEIDAGAADATQFAHAIEQAGYTPVPAAAS